MLERVADVGEIRVAGLDIADQLKCFGHAQVGRMWLPAQRIHHNHVQIVQQRARRGRHATRVSQVGKVVDAIAGCADRAVAHRDGLNARLAHVERLAVNRRVVDVGDQPDPGCAGEGIGEALTQRHAGWGIAEAR